MYTYLKYHYIVHKCLHLMYMELRIRYLLHAAWFLCDCPLNMLYDGQLNMKVRCNDKAYSYS